MASTNKTKNSNLSQFVQTDKPTFLGDYNSDMNKIDTALETVKDGFTNADVKIGDLTQLTTENKLDLVDAINEIDAKEKTLDNDVTNLMTNATNNEWLTNDIEFNNNDFTILNNPSSAINLQSIRFNQNKNQFNINGYINVDNFTYSEEPSTPLKIELPINNIHQSSKFYNVGYVIDEDNNNIVYPLIVILLDNKIQFSCVIKKGTTATAHLRLIIIDSIHRF